MKSEDFAAGITGLMFIALGMWGCVKSVIDYVHGELLVFLNILRLAGILIGGVLLILIGVMLLVILVDRIKVRTRIQTHRRRKTTSNRSQGRNS